MEEHKITSLPCPFRILAKAINNEFVVDADCQGSYCPMYRKYDKHTYNALDNHCTSERCLPGCKYGEGYCGLPGKEE